MKKIKKSSRVKEIENKQKDSIENLLYKWHWRGNLKHKEIGKKLRIPRSTITRWFKQLNVPTQSHTRFTNDNLLYMGSNRLPKKPKPPKKIKKRISVNEDFFKKWSPGMAYVLGYFTTDGCMFVNPRGSHYILFTSTDSELIYKTRELLGSAHQISIRKSNNPKWKDRYTLQIGSKKMFQNLLRLGLTPNKSKTVKLPKIPKKHLNHFIRGYFDGDGCIFFKEYQRKTRKTPHYSIIAMFTSGNRKFLKDILKLLKKFANIDKGKIYQKSKNSGFELRFANKDNILGLYKFIYQNTSIDHFLERKYYTFQKILNHWGRRSIG